MINLLSANFMRLRKDKFFWLGMLFMFCMAVFIIINQYREGLHFEYSIYLDNVLFGYDTFIGILCAVFCSLFIGTEYSDGTIRNKLIVGQRRSSIYLANLIVSIAAAFLMCLSFTVAVFTVGTPLLNWIQTDLGDVLLLLLASLLMICACCALCTLLSMLCQNKAVAAIIALIGMFVMMFTCMFLLSRLSEPKMFDSSFATNEAGAAIQGDAVPNPHYISGTKRKVFQFLVDILPGGQMFQYTSLLIPHPIKMMGASIVTIFAATGIGVLAFGKKDIK